jgi:hypothetical protein
VAEVVVEDGEVVVVEAEEADEVEEVVEDDDPFDSPSLLSVSHITSYRVVSIHKTIRIRPQHIVYTSYDPIDVPDADTSPQEVLPNANPTPTGPFLAPKSLPTATSPSIFGSCSLAWSPVTVPMLPNTCSPKGDVWTT